MQKSGKIIWDFMPRTIVPLDSAYIFPLYALYYNALRHFWQARNSALNKSLSYAPPHQYTTVHPLQESEIKKIPQSGDFYCL